MKAFNTILFMTLTVISTATLAGVENQHSQDVTTTEPLSAHVGKKCYQESHVSSLTAFSECGDEIIHATGKQDTVALEWHLLQGQLAGKA